MVPEQTLQEQQIRELQFIELIARQKLLSKATLMKLLETQREQGKSNKFSSFEEILLDEKALTQDSFLNLRSELARQFQANENKRVLKVLNMIFSDDKEKVKALSGLAEDANIVLLSHVQQQKLVDDKQATFIKKKSNELLIFEYEKILSRLCLGRKLITQQQLTNIFKKKEKMAFSEYLMREGYLKKEEIQALMDIQKVRAVEHFTAMDLVGVDIRFRDNMNCPHCGKEIFIDDVECKHCRKSVSQKRGDNTLNYSINELEVVDVKRSGLDVSEWYLRTSAGPKGPYSLRRLMQGVSQKKITLDLKMRKGEKGPWINASQMPHVARAFGVCYSCGDLRPKKEGPCPSCDAVE